jgi:hypothetical protein
MNADIICNDKSAFKIYSFQLRNTTLSDCAVLRFPTA